MSTRTYRTFQALILAGLGLYLMGKLLDGRVLFYISQRFIVLVLLAAVALLILAQLVLRERPPADADTDSTLPSHEHEEAHNRQGWMLWVLALPLLFGLLVPERPLNASALASRGVNNTNGLSARGSAAQALRLPAEQRSVLDWIRVYGESAQPAVYDGERADVTGFVYHDVRLAGNQFMVSRFTIACCVADAMALGMIVEWPQASALPDSRWVRVRGTIHAVESGGKTLPGIIAEQVETIPQPEQPYLFP